MKHIFDIIEINGKNKELWDRLLFRSDYNTPFIRDDYLNAVGCSSMKITACVKSEPVAGLCIPYKTDDLAGGSLRVVPFAPYQGFIYRFEDTMEQRNKNAQASIEILAYLKEKGCYEVHFSNLYFVKDFRFIQDVCDHADSNISVRYTAVKNLSESENISRLRKREWKKAKCSGLSAVPSKDISVFIDLYERTFLRQGIRLSAEELDLAASLTAAVINNGYGELWNEMREDGTVVNSRVILCGESSYAYDLFAGNHPDHRDLGGSTALVLELFEYLKNKGYKYFDFLGANSPRRGDYKLSFESRLQPYYLCDLTLRDMNIYWCD